MITCTFENGHETSKRHVTVDGIVHRNQQVLLVKRAPDALIEAGKWCLPGGYLERDETPEEGVVREVREETGYSIISGVKLFAINALPHRPNEDRQNIDFVFTMQVDGEPNQHDDEVTEVKWFALDSLPKNEQIAFDHLSFLERYQSQQNSNLWLQGFSS